MFLFFFFLKSVDRFRIGAARVGIDALNIFQIECRQRQKESQAWLHTVKSGAGSAALLLPGLIFMSPHERLHQFTLDAASALSWLGEGAPRVYRPGGLPSTKASRFPTAGEL